MIKEHVKYLVCPKCHNELDLSIKNTEKNHIISGELICKGCTKKYPIINAIPRFVEENNYADNFGLEWNTHSRTQYDDSSGFKISEERFINETKWGDNLNGEVILEAGSGSGRFTKHAVETGAMIISFDFSNAVEANYKSNSDNENLLIVQASIFEMPFKKNYFNRVLCIGVIQHTPDPRKAFHCLVTAIKADGHLCTDIYLKSLGKVYLTPKYLLRKITKRMNPDTLYKRTVSYINFIWPLTRLIRKIPKLGKKINWRLLVADYSELLPNADDKTLKEWAILDSYDMVSPAYDFPQTLKTFKKWHIEEGLEDIDVHYGYNGVEVRARKPK
ncbi:MAG: methyltransferase domain-containing protein [Bacteroidetes bacterium]|nr:methyltransferase domain-containing protein [Bacteroidota bacterium]